MKKIFLILIRIYQKILSPDTGLLSYFFSRGCCRYYPSCSEYSYQAIKKYGVIKGLFLTIKRLSRCQPFSPGGYDPIK